MQVDAQLLPAINEIISNTELKLRSLLGFHVNLRIELNNGEINEAYIQNMVCSYFGVSWKDIKSPKRETDIKNARFVYIWLSIQWLRKTLVAIGKDLNRDHTTILHARDAVKDLLDVEDAIYHKAIATIEIKLKKRETQAH